MAGKAYFSPRTLLDRQQQMWELWQSGQEMSQAAAVLGWDRGTVLNRIAETGGVRTRRRQTSARLSFEDRVHIEVGLKQNRSMRAIAADLGRAPSTISREVDRHRTPAGGYEAKRAHAIAFEDAKRPQRAKIEAHPQLREQVLHELGKMRSPEQIAGRLRHDFPDDPEMHVHHETIYRWLYLQGRGELKREISAALRSGRAMRRPNKHGRSTGQGQIPDMVSIHDRPPVDLPDGTRIPGHWESQWCCQAA